MINETAHLPSFKVKIEAILRIFKLPQRPENQTDTASDTAPATATPPQKHFGRAQKPKGFQARPNQKKNYSNLVLLVVRVIGAAFAV